MRRSREDDDDGSVTVGGLRIDGAAHRVSTPATSPLHVGPTEYRLLHFFMTHAERVYTRTQLLDHVWGGNVYVEERTVDVHIRRLRKALEPTGSTTWCRPCAAPATASPRPWPDPDASGMSASIAADAPGLATVAACACCCCTAPAVADRPAGPGSTGLGRCWHRHRAGRGPRLLAPVPRAALPRLAQAAAHRRTARACGRRWKP